MRASNSSPLPTPLVVFDFDHTLTDRETLSRFLLTCLPLRRVVLALSILPLLLIGFWMRWGWREGFKRACLHAFLRGLPEEEFLRLASQYSERTLPKSLRPEMKRRLNTILAADQEVWLISGSLSAYLTPFAKTLGISAVLACDMAVGKDGRLTGGLQGGNCWGPEKLRRLRLLERSPHRPLIMYGDSAGDRQLLEVAWEGHFMRR
jgi:phosphatidylglycerophosphatase C